MNIFPQFVDNGHFILRWDIASFGVYRDLFIFIECFPLFAHASKVAF